MSTVKFCDLCGEEIPANQMSKAVTIHIQPMAERNQSESMFFARDYWQFDVCLGCMEKDVAPALSIGPLLKGGG